MATPAPARRVLFVTPFPPRADGRHGGSRAIAHTIHSATTRHEVALVCRRTAADPPLDPVLAAECVLVEEIQASKAPRAWPGRATTLARHLVGAGRPRWAAAVHVEGFARRLSEVAETFSPEVTQIEYQVMGQYLPALEGVDTARVLVALEPGTPAAKERLAAARGLDRIRHRLDLRAWRRWEAEILGQVDLTVVFTERDRRALAELAPGQAIRTVPVGLPLPAHALDPLGTDPASVVFVGNFAHPPNVAAAASLANEILPRVRREFPALRAFLVGPDPPAAVLDLADDLTVVTGAVPEVAPYLDRATAVLAPMWSGGGMRIKVLDALGAGKALVATSLALQGFDVVDGEHVRVADSPEAFAEAVVELLDDPELRARLSRNARQWAASNFDPETTARRYEQVWEEAIANATLARP